MERNRFLYEMEGGKWQGQRICSESQSSLDTPNAALWVLHEVMFPDADNAPALFVQFSIHKYIPCFVGIEFLSPEWPVVGGHV
jgi:hypothetical protein